MKNLCTFLLLVASVTVLSAQIQKGSIILGGTVGFNNVSEEGESITVVNVSPTAGFFLNDRFALGSSLNFAVLASEGEDATTIGLTPFVRGYFNGSGTARFFGQLSLGFQSLLSGDEGTTLLVLGAGIGADFFLNEHVAIEGFLGYQRVQDPGDFGTNNIGLNFGIAAFIGRDKE